MFIGLLLKTWQLLKATMHFRMGWVVFLPEASFDPRLMSLPASVCVNVCVCLSVCVSVNPELARAITHHAFKLEPSNLDNRCKTTWLRYLLFKWRLTLTFRVKFNLRSQIYHNSPPIQARTTKFWQKMQTSMPMVLIVLGAIGRDFHDQV